MKKVLALVAWFGRRAQPAPLAPGNSFAGLNETEIQGLDRRGHQSRLRRRGERGKKSHRSDPDGLERRCSQT